MTCSYVNIVALLQSALIFPDLLTMGERGVQDFSPRAVL